jgi:DNA-binding NtrC family response regulator
MHSSVPAAVLLVTTDNECIAGAARAAAEMGARLTVAPSPRAARGVLRERPFDLVLVRADWPASDICPLPEGPSGAGPAVPVVVLARRASIPDAVRAMRAGADDYLALTSEDGNPWRKAMARALAPDGPGTDGLSTGGLSRFLSGDSSVLAAWRTVACVADSGFTVMIEGEKGTGRKALARELHDMSARSGGPFVVCDCALLPADDVERHVLGRGSGERGALWAADGGTFVLAEADLCAPRVLDVLLRMSVAAQRPSRGLGERPDGGAPDVRLVLTATERTGALEALAQGCVCVGLPPLRHRPADVPRLARHFAHLLAAAHGRPVPGLSEDAMAALVRYGWPGNVRELRDAVERAVLLDGDGAIRVEHLPEAVRESPGVYGGLPARRAVPLKAALRGPMRGYLLDVLDAVGWNVRRAAGCLGISRSTLYRRMKDYGLGRQGLRSASEATEAETLEVGQAAPQ